MKTNKDILKRNHSFEICGDQYSVVSDAPKDQVERAADYVDSLMRDLIQKTGLKDHKRVAVLAALQLSSKVADLEEQLRLKEEQGAYLGEQIDRILSSYKNAD